MRYVRTGLRSDEYDGGEIAAIRALADLYQYYNCYNDNKYNYGLSGSFADAEGVYDAAFFEENALVVTTLYEPNGLYATA